MLTTEGITPQKKKKKALKDHLLEATTDKTMKSEAIMSDQIKLYKEPNQFLEIPKVSSSSSQLTTVGGTSSSDSTHHFIDKVSQ